MKYALFSFNGDPICFIHVILNSLDLAARGHDVKVILEGGATKLIDQFSREDGPLYGKYQELLKSGLIHGVCRACANKMGTLKEAERLGLPIKGEMEGHPAMGEYLDQGYQVLSF